MAMDTIQVRLTPKQMASLRKLVRKGMYTSRGEAIRDAVRKMLAEHSHTG